MPRFLRNPWFLFGLGLWQLVVMFTPVSLYGFWTDVVVLLSWGGLLVRSAFFDPAARPWLRWMAGAVALVLIIWFFTLISTLGGLFFLSELTGARSVPQQQKLQGAYLVNQYFIPTGAYGCGMGKLITAKALIFFPFIEYRTEYDRCTHEDWGYLIKHDSWEGWDEGPAQ